MLNFRAHNDNADSYGIMKPRKKRKKSKKKSKKKAKKTATVGRPRKRTVGRPRTLCARRVTSAKALKKYKKQGSTFVVSPALAVKLKKLGICR